MRKIYTHKSIKIFKRKHICKFKSIVKKKISAADIVQFEKMETILNWCCSCYILVGSMVCSGTVDAAFFSLLVGTINARFMSSSCACSWYQIFFFFFGRMFMISVMNHHISEFMIQFDQSHELKWSLAWRAYATTAFAHLLISAFNFSESISVRPPSTTGSAIRWMLDKHRSRGFAFAVACFLFSQPPPRDMSKWCCAANWNLNCCLVEFILRVQSLTSPSVWSAALLPLNWLSKKNFGRNQNVGMLFLHTDGFGCRAGE